MVALLFLAVLALFLLAVVTLLFLAVVQTSAAAPPPSAVVFLAVVPFLAVFLAVVPFLRGRPLRARGLLFGGASSPDQLEPESYVCVYELEGWSKHVKIITNLCFFLW